MASFPGALASPDVTIVVPVYGNAATLPALAARVRDAMDGAGLTFRLLLVVDASPDESWSIVRQLASADTRIAGLLLADNVGQHAAVLAGLASADARWFVVMDADLQDAPEAIPDLVARAREHGVDASSQHAVDAMSGGTGSSPPDSSKPFFAGCPACPPTWERSSWSAGRSPMRCAGSRCVRLRSSCSRTTARASATRWP